MSVWSFLADDITHHELSFLLETPKLFFNRILIYFEHWLFYCQYEKYNETMVSSFIYT